MLKIPGYGRSAKLMLYLVLVDQLSDVLQYVWGKLLGKHKIAPGRQPEQDLGRLRRRRAHGHADRNRVVVDDAVSSVGGSAGFAHHYAHGLCRRPDHVGHQARPGRKRLRHA